VQARRRESTRRSGLALAWTHRKIAFAAARKLLGKGSREVADDTPAPLSSRPAWPPRIFETPSQGPQRAKRWASPDLIQLLQDDAQALRKRYDELHERAECGGGDAAASHIYGDLRASRDANDQNLGTPSGALETIMLDSAGAARVILNLRGPDPPVFPPLWKSPSLGLRRHASSQALGSRDVLFSSGDCYDGPA